MSPIFEYRCPEGHVVEAIRRYDDRGEHVRCVCGADASPIISVPAKRTDGIYSYAPNIGSEQRFERQRRALQEGRGVIDGSHDV